MMKYDLMIDNLLLSGRTTEGEEKFLMRYQGKISKGTKLTMSETSFIVRLHAKYCC